MRGMEKVSPVIPAIEIGAIFAPIELAPGGQVRPVQPPSLKASTCGMRSGRCGFVTRNYRGPSTPLARGLMALCDQFASNKDDDGNATCGK